MKEIRFHGRGGQGVVIGAEMLAGALVIEGKYVSSFPSFGAERRGAPVAAFLRFDEEPVRKICQIYEPHCIVIQDPVQIKNAAVFKGLRDEKIVLLNAQIDSIQKNFLPNLSRFGVIDATSIGIELIGKAISNTCLLGAFAKITKWVSIDSIISSLQLYFQGEALNKNIKAAKRGYQEVKVLSLSEITK